jgi:tetratricopeptide (TPR) repeat protein
MLKNQEVSYTDAYFFIRRAFALESVKEFERAVEEYKVAEKLIKTNDPLQNVSIAFLYTKLSSCYSQAHQFENALDVLARLSHSREETIRSLLKHNLCEVLTYTLSPTCPKIFFDEVMYEIDQIIKSAAHNPHSQNANTIGILKFFKELHEKKSLLMENDKGLSIMFSAVELGVSPEIIKALEESKIQAAKHRIKIAEKELETCEDDDKKKKIYLQLADNCYIAELYDDAIFYCNMALIILGVKDEDPHGFLFIRAFSNFKSKNYENAIADFATRIDKNRIYEYVYSKNLHSFKMFDRMTPEEIWAQSQLHLGLAYLHFNNPAKADLQLIKFMQREYKYKLQVFNVMFPHALVERALDLHCSPQLVNMVQERLIKMALACDGTSEKDEDNKKICNYYLSLLGKREVLYADSVDVHKFIFHDAKLKIPELYEKILKTIQKDSFSYIDASKRFSQADIFSRLQIKPQRVSATPLKEQDLFTVDMLESKEMDEQDIDFSDLNEVVEPQRSAFHFMN